MIEEELYQRASDELNSDDRDHTLWARACALASDDHDEARYLYTNLRVEQWIEERKSGSAAATATPEVSDEAVVPSRPFGSVSDMRESPAGESDMPTLRNAVPSNLDLDPIDDFSVVPDELIPDDETPVYNTAEALYDGGLTLEDHALESAKDDSIGGRPTGDVDVEELDWLNDAVVSADTPTATTPAGPMLEALPADRTLSALEQTAQMADPQTTDAALARALPVSEEASRPLDDTLPFEGQTAKGPGDAAAFGSGMRDDYADTRDLDSLLEDEEPADSAVDDSTQTEIPTGRGGKWAVYETDGGSLKSVKRGVSWGALFLTFPWLLSRGLIGTAITYGLLWVVSLGGLLLTGLAWMDRGADASDMLKLACAGFALVAFIGLIVLPFFRANRWREGRFKRKGYTMRAKVRARNANEAIGRLRRPA